ncbi:MAG: 2-amino-4-hydroxy-6-hydroxymethyldihydropteridine diphosphokinase [Bacteroidales bacterium]|jgi:2-amino-4-hydroxy-6-hydroxymethyldihydropteridine diphosphokinase|nr:2-amino-4-hydroxy-6-hydroxymethyldihydropteridine diphosphokinase [Bacteroidales bacterium]
MSSFFLLLGANTGNCLETLEKSRVLIAERVGKIMDLSPIYRSEPWGFECKDWFYNQAIRCETSLSPEEVLDKILTIEAELGRRRTETQSERLVSSNAQHSYEPRSIDIDILYFDNEIISAENLQIPHKHLQDRRFALIPLCDIASEFVHPILKKTSLELLEICEDECVVVECRDERFFAPAKPPKYPYIAIEGVIGVGKTTLATLLSETFNAKLVLESFDANPFLPKFYENREKYAFPVELSFMAERFQQLQDQLIAPDLFHDIVVSDYITEKSLIFAANTLSEDVFALYSKLFYIIFAQLPKPDLLVYLYASPEKLKQNIIKRGRDYEQNIELDYLAQLQDGYLEHFKNVQNQRILIIDVNNLDFVDNPADYHKILGLLQENYPLGISIRNLQITDDQF